MSDAPYQVHHTGIDIGAPVGTPVHSAMTGIVQQVANSPSQGNFVIIDHGLGVTTRYYHLNTVIAARNTAIVIGSEIGTVGSTGYSTGPHLHFETRIAGIPVNPRLFLKGDP